MNACALKTHIFYAQAKCRNTIGSHTKAWNPVWIYRKWQRLQRCRNSTIAYKATHVYLHSNWSLFLFLGSTFLDKDECALENHNCHFEALCNNTPGSYTCACNEGFTGNGKICNGELNHG